MDPSPDMTVSDLLNLLVATTEERVQATHLQYGVALIKKADAIRAEIIERCQGAPGPVRAVNGPRIPGQPRSAS